MNTTGMMGGIGIAEIILMVILIGLAIWIIMALYFSGGKTMVGATGECPLCGKSKHMPKAQLLYGHSVCKKCYYAFNNRRQLAFVIDFTLWIFILKLLERLIGIARTEVEAIVVSWMELLVFFMFFMKDGFAGYSPGKALLGLRTINEISGKPIGPGASFKRNLPLIVPLMPLIISVQLCKGHRIGDKWSMSKVIWKRYATHPLFLPKSSLHYTVTPAEI